MKPNEEDEMTLALKTIINMYVQVCSFSKPIILFRNLGCLKLFRRNHYKNIWRVEFLEKVMHIIQLSYVLQSLFSQQEAHFINWWDSLDANKSICWVTTLRYIFSKIVGLSFHSEESILFTKSNVVLHNSIYQADTPLLLGYF